MIPDDVLAELVKEVREEVENENNENIIMSRDWAAKKELESGALSMHVINRDINLYKLFSMLKKTLIYDSI